MSPASIIISPVGSGTALLASAALPDEVVVVAVEVSAGLMIESIQLCSDDTRDMKLPPGRFAA
jgi:hypothetical protein